MLCISAATITTLGYGDIVAISACTRSLVGLEFAIEVIILIWILFTSQITLIIEKN
ncbi:ion channel [Wukongibacter baidiensis]